MFDKATIKLVGRRHKKSTCNKYRSCFENETYKHNNVIFIYNKNTIIAEKSEKKVCTEIEQRLRLRHPNIANILDSFQDYYNIYIIYESYDSMLNMKELIETRYLLDYDVTANLIAQVFSALFYLRENDIDLKELDPKRIEINRRNGRVKLCLDLYYKKSKAEIFARKHPEYIMPHAHNDEESPYISPEFYSAGVILKKLARIGSGPCTHKIHAFFLIVGLVNEICSLDHNIRSRFTEDYFLRLRTNRLFLNIDWFKVEPPIVNFLQFAQKRIYEYASTESIEEICPTTHFFGEADGFGPIFKFPEIRYPFPGFEPFERHVYYYYEE